MVISDNFVKPKGTVISEKELGRANISALLGRHIALIVPEPPAKDKEK